MSLYISSLSAEKVILLLKKVIEVLHNTIIRYYPCLSPTGLRVWVTAKVSLPIGTP